MTTTGEIALALAGVVERGAFTVPPYPAVALRLQRLLASETYSVDDVAGVLATDAALAATVLATANSAVHGSGLPITSLSRAVNRLGARTVGAIAVASGISAAAVASGVLLDVKYQVWRRTMITALTSQKLAKTRGLGPDEAFLAGLLHGFGRSIAVASIEQVLKSQHAVWPLSAAEWMSIAEEQRAPLARTVAQHWQLPEVLARAIESEKRGDSTLGDLVLDADLMARALERGETPESQSSAEEQLVEELMIGLPSVLETFMSPGADSNRRAPSPFVTKVEHALVGELYPSCLTVVEGGAKKGSHLTCIAVAPCGLEVLSAQRFQECAIIRMAIAQGGDSFEPWFTVLLCVPEGSGYRVEFQLFSPTRDVREQWRGLYSAAEALAVVPVGRAAGADPR